MNRQTIYIAAYPKSGSTYLTRLLGDVLNSPTGGCMPAQDYAEIATEGWDRPGPYVVRKGHFVLVDNNTGPVVPSPHRLAWKRLTDEKIVFLIRDPRDICVSGAYHWRCTPAEFLDRMIRGDVARCGRWDEYCEKYLSRFGPTINFVYDCYENILESPVKQVDRIMKWLHLLPILSTIQQSVNRQSFATRSKGLTEQEMRRNNMRLGKVGDWKNHFTQEMNDRIWHEFGWMMERLGYER